MLKEVRYTEVFFHKMQAATLINKQRLNEKIYTLIENKNNALPNQMLFNQICTVYSCLMAVLVCIIKIILKLKEQREVGLFFIFRYSFSQKLVCFSLFVFRYSLSEVSLFFVFRYSFSQKLVYFSLFVLHYSFFSLFVFRYSFFFFFRHSESGRLSSS